MKIGKSVYPMTWVNFFWNGYDFSCAKNSQAIYPLIGHLVVVGVVGHGEALAGRRWRQGALDRRAHARRQFFGDSLQIFLFVPPVLLVAHSEEYDKVLQKGEEYK